MSIAKRRFGRTQLQIPEVTFGGGWVGGVLIHHDRDQAHGALDMAYAAGIDWIDTAAQYGDGVSETVIGGWLKGRAANAMPGLSTKFRIDPEKGDFAGQMMRIVEGSLSRLGQSRVPVIILHNQIDQDGAVGRGSRALSASQAIAMADTMETLREQGLCDHLGMTALGDPVALHQVVDTGRFDVAQVYYNMLNPTALAGRTPWNSTDFDGLLTRCAAQDMGVMGIRIFAAGHLATNQRHGREIPVTANVDDAAEEARAAVMQAAIGADHGTPAQTALRFGLGCELLSTIVVGLGEIAHLEQVIEAARLGPLPAQVMDTHADALLDHAFTQ